MLYKYILLGVLLFLCERAKGHVIPVIDSGNRRLMRREGYSSVSTRRVLGESQDRELINDLDPDEDTDDIIIFVVQPGSISRYAALCEDSLVVSNKEGSTVKVGQEPVCDVCQCGIDDPVCLKLVETNLIKSTEINDSAHGCECAWENVCEYVVYGSPTLDFNCTAE